MSREQRVRVWLISLADRPNLMLQWVDSETGRRRSKSAGTADPEEGERARADKEYELNNNLHREPSKMPWPRFRELFETEYAAPLRADTRRNYRVALDLFEEICTPTTLAKVTERTISKFATELRKRPGTRGRTAAAGTVKVRLQFLHTVLEWAASQKLIAACPDFPTVKVPKTKPQPVPVESFERLLAAAEAADDPQMPAFLQCAWLAGLRLNEAMALRREQEDLAPWVDWDRQRIWLPAGFVKADEDQWVPLDPELRRYLEALPEREDGRLFAFLEARSGKLVKDIAVSHRVVELALRAGVRLTYRSLRRGFGCRYAGKVPAQVLQRLMRHSNITVTMDYYANVDEAVEAAVLGQHNKSHNSRRGVGADRSANHAASHSQDGCCD